MNLKNRLARLETEADALSLEGFPKVWATHRRTGEWPAHPRAVELVRRHRLAILSMELGEGGTPTPERVGFVATDREV